MLVVGLGAGLAASAAYSGGVVLQALDARDTPGERGLRVSLLAQLLRCRRWVLGTLLSILAFPIQVLAYANAPVPVVQSCLAAGLVLVLFLGARAMDEPVRRRDYAAVVAITAGVALAAAAGPVRTESARGGIAPIVLMASIGIFALLPYAFAARAAPLSAVVTASAGLAFAWNDLATKLFGDSLGTPHALAALAWLAAVALSAIVATLSEMTAFQRSAVTKVVPGVFVLETFVPILTAPLLLRTRLPGATLSGLGFYSGLLLTLGAIAVIATSEPVSALMRRGVSRAREARRATRSIPAGREGERTGDPEGGGEEHVE